MDRNESLDVALNDLLQRVRDASDEGIELSLGEGINVQTELFFVVNIEDIEETFILRKVSDTLDQYVIFDPDDFQEFVSRFVRHDDYGDVKSKLMRHKVSQGKKRRSPLVDWDAHL